MKDVVGLNTSSVALKDVECLRKKRDPSELIINLEG